jgi:hypothetical protein
MEDIEFAKDRAKRELSKPSNKNVFVTVPDGNVYLNSDPDSIKKHCKDNKLKIIHVKIDGVIQK